MQTQKRNIVDGVDHMGSIYRILPHIARVIEADYREADLDRAYWEFSNLPEPENPLPDDHDGKGVYWTNWVLQGRLTHFTVCFEKYEMLYGWSIPCPDEETYLRLEEAIWKIHPRFMEGLSNSIPTD
jgi:hypothetical protein